MALSRHRQNRQHVDASAEGAKRAALGGFASLGPFHPRRRLQSNSRRTRCIRLAAVSTSGCSVKWLANPQSDDLIANGEWQAGSRQKFFDQAERINIRGSDWRTIEEPRGTREARGRSFAERPQCRSKYNRT